MRRAATYKAVLQPGTRLEPLHGVEQLHEAAENLARRLSPANDALAATLLLGAREQRESGRFEAFFLTGGYWPARTTRGAELSLLMIAR
jgi:hypothetical protein